MWRNTGKTNDKETRDDPRRVTDIIAKFASTPLAALPKRPADVGTILVCVFGLVILKTVTCEANDYVALPVGFPWSFPSRFDLSWLNVGTLKSDAKLTNLRPLPPFSISEQHVTSLFFLSLYIKSVHIP